MFHPTSILHSPDILSEVTAHLVRNAALCYERFLHMFEAASFSQSTASPFLKGITAFSWVLLISLFCGFLCLYVFLYFPPFNSGLLFQWQHRPRTCFVSSTFVFLNNSNNRWNNKSSTGTKLCPGWCLPQTLALNFLEIPKLLWNKETVISEDVVGWMILLPSFSFICFCPGICLCDVFL